jgi:hypothetical protein
MNCLPPNRSYSCGHQVKKSSILEQVAFDRIQSFSRLPEAAFAVANALKQPAEFN